MLRPRVPCVIYKVAFDLYAQEKVVSGMRAMCSVVTLRLDIEKTSVRTDSSASRGAAEESVATARLLFPPATNIKENDIVVVQNERLRVKGIFPRPKLYGGIDHLQVELVRG